MKKYGKAIILTLILLALLGYTAYQSYQYWTVMQRERSGREKRRSDWRELAARISERLRNFDGKAGIEIQDLSANWVFRVNPDLRFASASMAKVPIMAGVFWAAESGKLDLASEVTLRSRDKTAGSGKLKGEPAGTSIQVQGLIEMMIAESDNTATNMLIGLLGIDYFNGYFRRIGLRNTNLSRKMMDFKARRMGVENYTTAYEQSCLLRSIYRGRLINRDVSTRCLEILRRQHLRDRIPKRLPPGVPVAHKTGLENGVCHDAGIVFTPRGDLLICVLTGHNYRTAAVAKKLIADISLDAYNYLMEN